MKISKEIRTIIEKNPISIATTSKGKPHVIAVSFAKVKGNKIIITDNYMKTTAENIRKNPNISIVAWNKKLIGYQIDGRAKYFNKGKYRDFIKSLKENKGYPAKGAILITITKIRKSA